MLSATEYAQLQAGFGRTAPDAMALRLENLSSLHEDDARIWFLLGASRHQGGKLEAALEAFDRVLLLAPDHLQALNAKGGLLAALGRRDEAQGLLETTRARFPLDPAVLVNLGYLYEQDVSGGERALECYDAALALDPCHRSALMNRGYLLTLMKNLPDAVENNRQLAQCHPRLAVAHFNLADTLLAQRNYVDAIEATSRAIECDPSYVKAYTHRTLALAATGHLDAADEDLRTTRRLDLAAFDQFRSWLYGDSCQVFDEIDVRCIYLHLLYRDIVDCEWSRWSEFVREFDHLVRDATASGNPILDSTLPFISLAFPIGKDARIQLAKGVAEALLARAAVTPTVEETAPRALNKRIRLGYVSPDFRKHPGGFLIRRLFRLHDRSRFEVYGYALDPDDGSDVRREIRAGCDVFRDVGHLPSDRLAEIIANDGIDIIIDRSGFTRGTRPQLFSGRVAPVQASYLGFPGTLGAAYMDYAIVDRVVCPDGEERWWTENLVHMPDTYFITNNKQAIDPDETSRRELGLPDAAFVFCCFNNSYKFDPETFHVWTQILHRVPGSVLWLYAPRPAVRENLIREAWRWGIESERLVFASFEGRHERHLARHRAVDLFLDTRHYNAHTTAVDALWSGVPVLTVPGDTMPSRVGASLLSAAGLPEMICNDWAEYQELAVWLATHPDELAIIKWKLAENRSSCPLFNTEARVRQLEAAFAEMWKRHLAGLPPASFEVKRQPTPEFRNRWH